MGFFSWFKNLFNKTIHGSKSGKEIVFLGTKSTIKIGQDIEVKPNFVGVVVAKGLVCDVFPEGRHRLEPKELPLASRKLKLTRQNKKGELPTKFKADIYFVNLAEYTSTFKSKNFVKTKDSEFNKLKIKLSGKYDFKVINPIDFLEALLTQFGVIDDAIAEDEIEEWVSSLCVKAVQKNKPTAKELYQLNPNCFEGVKDYINGELYDCGIKIGMIEVTQAEFPKKLQKTLAERFGNNAEQKVKNQPNLFTKEQYEQNSQNVYQNYDVYGNEARKIENQMQNDNYNSRYDVENSYNGYNQPNFDVNNYSQNQSYDNNMQNTNQSYNDNYDNYNGQQNYDNNYNQNYNGDYNNANYNDDYYGNQNYNDNYNTQNQSYHNDLPGGYDGSAEQNQIFNKQGNENAIPIQKSISYKRCPNCNAINSVGADVCFSCGKKFVNNK